MSATKNGRTGTARFVKRKDALLTSPSPVCIMPFDVYFYMRAERSRFRTSDLLAAVLEPTKCAGGDRRRASRIGNYYVRHNCLAAHIFDRRVLSLGDYAFRAWDPCAKMCSAHATIIGDGAFYGCSSLPSITLPDCVTIIGDGAFRDCSSLTSITIPNSVTIIGDGAFRDCSSLNWITIPDSVTSIGVGAFSGCSSLAFSSALQALLGVLSRALGVCLKKV